MAMKLNRQLDIIGQNYLNVEDVIGLLATT